MKTFRVALPAAGVERAPEESEIRKGVAEQVLHLVKEQNGPPASGEESLGEPKLLEPLAACRLVSVIVGLAHAEERHAEPLGQHLAELGLAGARGAVQEHVHARSTGVEGTIHQPFDVVAVGADVVEVRPLEVARGRGAQQQVSDVDARVAGDGGEAVQPADKRQVSVAVDGDEPRAHERRVVSKPPVDGVCRDSKEHGQRRILEVEGVDVPAGGTEDVIHHRLDDRLGLVAEQQFQDSDVGSGKVRCRREGSEPLRSAVESRLRRRRTFVPQGFCESAQLFRRHPLLGVQLHAAQTGPLAPAAARNPILPVRNPFGERRSLPVPVVKT